MDITELKGIGTKTGQLFEKVGITTVEELLHYYPLHYKEYKEPGDICNVAAGETVSVRGIIKRNPILKKGRRTSIIISEAWDRTGRIRIMWFNSPYLVSRIKAGRTYVFCGKASEYKGSLILEHPEIFDEEDYKDAMSSFKPVYGLTKGLSNNTVIKAVRQALAKYAGEPDHIMPEIIRFNGLLSSEEALRGIHFPSDGKELEKARNRLVFDEFFMFIMEMRFLKDHMEERHTDAVIKDLPAIENVIDGLPYRLTADQLNAWEEIRRDMTGSGVMNRLLEGDVGSGKTIVSFLALILCALNGHQAVMMAPTQVLAVQHYEKFIKLAENCGIDGINPVLLKGSLSEKEKRSVHEKIRDGFYNVIIGTHALIEENTVYKDAALLVTDEQHRFGVRQRKALNGKNSPHLLVMSATPIPRTLGLILYGDLDISVINEKPSDRIRIKTAVVGKEYMERSLDFIREELEKGRQAYVVCPMIEANEESDLENVKDVTSMLKKCFKGFTVGTLHGRMKGEEKEAVMSSFAEGKISVLVSTTVIEVGVDVPNASVMMVLNSERFGLATLHQLRGRVGRGAYQSYCIFMAGTMNDTVSERLGILGKTDDGFEIAKKDLSMRGPGDILGLAQSGGMNFALADITADSDILMAADRTVKDILSDDPALVRDENSYLKELIRTFIKENELNIVL